MAKIVDLPDGTEGEFPDDMSDEDIAAVLSQQFPAPETAPTVEAIMGEQAKGDLGTALKTGIAKSATKLVRGVGTTMLPKAAERWAEQRGFLPSEADVNLLEAGTSASPAATAAAVGGDIATDLLPAARVMRGANTIGRALPRAMGFGAASGAVRAEEADVPKEAVMGAVGGGLGEVGGRAVGAALSNVVRPSTNARELMRRGVTPTLGEGVDQSRWTGRAVAGLERMLEPMPLIGAPIRRARARATGELFDEAAATALGPNAVLPGGTNRQEIADRLLQNTKQDLGTALAGTTVRVSPAHHAATNAEIDRLAQQYGVSDDVADAIKLDLNRLLWSGVRGGRMSARSLENIKEDLFAGLPSARNNTNAQRLLKDLGVQLKGWVDSAASQAGHDLPSIRQAIVNAHVLRGAKPTAEGIGGEQLMRSLRANDARLGVPDTAAREMRDVAEAGSIIAPPRAAFGNRSVDQFARDAGLAREAGLGLTMGLGHAVGAGYNLANMSPAVRRLLMGDPIARAAFMRALSPAAVAVGTETTTER